MFCIRMAIFASMPKLERDDRASATSLEEKGGRQTYWMSLLRHSSLEDNMMRPLSATAPGSLEGIEKGSEEVHLEEEGWGGSRERWEGRRERRSEGRRGMGGVESEERGGIGWEAKKGEEGSKM